VEEIPDTGADQMLAQVTALVGVDLGAGVIEIFILDKGTQVVGNEVVRPCDHLPRQVRVICATASVDWDPARYRIYNFDACGFGVVNADTGARIWLEPAILGSNSQNEIKHKGTRINPSGRIALCYDIIKWIPESEIGTASETVVEEIAFHGWTNYARAKDITQLNAAKKSDVIFWIHVKAVSKERIVRIILCKRSVVTAVLIDISPHIDTSVEAEAIHWGRGRGDLFVFDSRARPERRTNCYQRNRGD
jgi:hypothetical protein